VAILKKLFEQKYPSSYFITKRGEQAPVDKDKSFVLDLSDLGKYLIAWHSKRPNVLYSEKKFLINILSNFLSRNIKQKMLKY